MKIYESTIETPLGEMAVYAVSSGIVILTYTDRKDFDTFVSSKLKTIGGEVVKGENEHIAQLRREIEEYFKGDRKDFSVKTVLFGTPFQISVWEMLRNIPFGETVTYSQAAAGAGSPKAVRAVGAANSKNAIEIVHPCHRVVGKSGALTGFASGIERKERLLLHEKR